ncbi:MAG: BTAD domain-containing putative transcriptional regulator [Pseudonocardiaceae bacterium]
MTAPVQLGGPKQIALLATLMVQANHLTSVEQLIDSIWADTPPTGAMATVHTYVSRLRRAFNAVETDGGQRIVTRPNGYLLRIEPNELDLAVFRGHVMHGRRAADAGQLQEAATELNTGLRLWRGPPLVDVSSEMLHRNEVPRLTEERLSALERRIAVDLELGRHGDLIAELRALTAENPLREQFWAQLMLALYRSKRQGEALAVYQWVRALHVEQIGLDPGPELQNLHAEILSNAPSLAAPAEPAPVSPKLAPQTMPAPSQLPTGIGLVGRKSIVNRVSALLSPRSERDATPVVVLSGLPGIGKTALATHIAHKLRPQFPDGQLYVNLRGYALAEPVTPTSVLARFLRALGLPPDRMPLDLDEQAALYRSLLADKQMLVVLDNASTAEHVRPLLPAGPRCAVVITSRDSLSGLTALDGATRFTLDVLPPADALCLLSALIGDARVLVEPAAAEELAELCGYLPLALRIAAANLATHVHVSLSNYVADLRAGNRLAALAIEGDEQTGVRAAFDLSYAALSPDGARLFRYLTLVPGPDFTAYAAAALLGTRRDHAHQLLSHLTATNLVQDSGPGRYQFHDLLRYYALQRSKSEDVQWERDHALERLYSLYFQTTCAASAIIEPLRSAPEPPTSLPSVGLPTLADRAAAVAWTEQEDRNLQAAVNHAAEHGPAPFAWHLADAMTSPLALTTRFAEWVSVTQTGLRVALDCGDQPGEAIMRLSLGHAYNTTGHLEPAVDQLSRALVLYRFLDRPLYQVPCHYAMGMSYLWTGWLDKAVEHLNATLDLSTRLTFSRYQANAVHGLGIARRYLGELPLALEQLTQSLKIGTADSGVYDQATWRFSLGLTYRDLGRFDEAVEQLTETLRGYEQLDNAFGISRSLIGLASTYLEMGQLETALTTARRGLSLSRQVKHSRTEADALNVLAAVFENLDRLAEAKQHHEAALTVADGMGPYLYGRIEAQIGLASVSRRLGQWEAAQHHAEAALASIRGSGFRLHEGKALLTQALIKLDIRDLDAAVEHCNNALAVCRMTGQRAGEMRTLQLLDQIKHSEAEELQRLLDDSSMSE